MRTSRIEKEINQIIVDNNEVNESVLNEVKSEMLKDKLHKTSTFRLSFPIKYARMMKVAIIIVFTILLPITGVGTYLAVNSWYGSNNITYHYEDLKKSKIESIEWYNQTHNTNYLWLEDLPVIDTSSLSNWKNEIVMLEEQYVYRENQVTLYMHQDKDIIKFSSYSNRRDKIILNDIDIYYAYNDSMEETMVDFNYLNIDYNLQFDYEVTNVKDTLIELFKNQSIFD